MSRLEELLAKTAAAADNGKSDFLSAGEHLVVLQKMYFNRGVNGLCGIVRMVVAESTTIPKGASRSVVFKMEGKYASLGHSNFKAWVHAAFLEMARGLGDAGKEFASVPFSKLDEPAFMKTLLELKIVGNNDTEKPADNVESEVEGLKLYVSSRDTNSQKGNVITVHNPRPFTAAPEKTKE